MNNSDSETESNYSDDENKPKTNKKVEIEEDDELSDMDDEEEDDDEILEQENEDPNQKIMNYVDSEIDDSEEEEEEEEEDNLKRIDEAFEKNIIEQYHPELKKYNNDEINTLCSIVRDVNGTIIDPFHRTLNFVTKYEKARILGERAKQINAGAKPFIEIPESMIDGYLIALEEFKQKKIPFIIQRPLPDKTIECWRLSDLEII
jgi:DNA-directed RNA polymerase subunit K/omega